MPAPWEFDQTIADEICERLSKGQSLRKICGVGRDDFLPGQSTVFKWLDDNAAFAKQYARAREAQADTYVDQIIDIADGKPVEETLVDAEVPESDPQRDRLRVDARKWVAGKLAPKKYGDKLDLAANLTGELGVTIKRFTPEPDGN